MTDLKTARRIRDVQFEMSQIAMSVNRTTHQRELHKQDEERGIRLFEDNLTRLGIGSTSSEQRKVMKEESGVFLARLDQTFKSSVSSEKEISELKRELNKRVSSKRNARLDKIKRQGGAS